MTVVRDYLKRTKSNVSEVIQEIAQEIIKICFLLWLLQWKHYNWIILALRNEPDKYIRRLLQKKKMQKQQVWKIWSNWHFKLILLSRVSAMFIRRSFRFSICAIFDFKSSPYTIYAGTPFAVKVYYILTNICYRY